jgi:tRNA U34 5-methylaminomethyl-2-thiouridine-forming methyltransferase MnmC
VLLISARLFLIVTDVTPDIMLTEDGSITCRENTSGELYHNQAGAYTEALTHYVQLCDLVSRANEQGHLTILDACFGLGYNSFVFLDSLIKNVEQGNITHSPIVCYIIGIDKDPHIFNIVNKVLADERFSKLREALHLDSKRIDRMLNNWHISGKDEFHLQDKIELFIQFEIKVTDLRQAVLQLVLKNQHFDYIFHDGFSPRTMPELWTVDLFKQYSKLLPDNGRLMTYSSAYAVRGALRDAGLQVRKSTSLGGKASGTLAFKNDQPEIVDNTIFYLSPEEEAALATRSAIPYRDPDFTDIKADIVKRRAVEIAASNLPIYKRW